MQYALLLAVCFATALAEAPRLTAVRGDVGIYRGGERVPAAANLTLTAGDRIVAGANSRADVWMDANRALRIDPRSEISLPEIDRLELLVGGMSWQVADPCPTAVQVDTPSVSIRIANAGEYRISVNKAGQTGIAAHRGDLEVFAPSGSQWVRAGSRMTARGAPSNPEFRMASAISRWRQLLAALTSMLELSVDAGASAASAGGETSQAPASDAGPTSAVPARKTDTVAAPPSPRPPAVR